MVLDPDEELVLQLRDSDADFGGFETVVEDGGRRVEIQSDFMVDSLRRILHRTSLITGTCSLNE
jgi:hypothetical protein